MSNHTSFDANERSIVGTVPSSSSGETCAAMEAYYDYVNVLARVSAWRCFQIKLDPADLAHEAMLRVRDKWSQLRSTDPAAIKSWLRSVVMSVLQDLADKAHAGKRDIAKEQSLEAALDESSARLEAFLPAHTATPSKSVVRRERVLALTKALGKLPRDQQMAIELHHFSGRSLEETAQAMNRSFASVAGLIRRGLRTLRESLQELD